MSVSMNTKTDDLIARFLLGELCEEERTQVEERFLADNEFFEEVLSAENALLDQYLLGQLSEEQRKRAETLFQSSPGQKRELEFTKELIAAVREADLESHQTTSAARFTTFIESTNKAQPVEEPVSASSELTDTAHSFSPLIPAGLKNRTLRFTATGLAAILLVGGSALFLILYLYSQQRSLKAQLVVAERSNQEAREKLSEESKGKTELSKQLEIDREKLEIEREKRARAEELITQSRIPRPDISTSLIFLTPMTLDRGSNSKTITLRAESKRVKFQLEVDENQRYSRYSALITTFDGRSVWSKDSIDARQIKRGRLTLVLPSSLLGYEDYRIELKGLSDSGDSVHVADYIFKVRK